MAIGDYRDTRIPGTFAIVALLYNGILDPRGADAQLDIFRNAARHLAPGGRFVVESLVLSDEQRAGGWWTTPRYVGSEHIELQFARYDIATNCIERTLVHMRPPGLQFLTVTDTYVSPLRAGPDGHRDRLHAAAPVRRLALRGLHGTQHPPRLRLRTREPQPANRRVASPD